jgi:glutamate N-acetyltransferase/amino-acid N-acetyltransferase
MKAPEYSDFCILPPGFQASGVHAGIKSKPGVLDMALLVSDEPDTVAAGVFTTNKIQAAPVRLDRERLGNGRARAVVINSGNANACTGPQGRLDAEEMSQLTAEALGISADEVLVCSTGSIGKPLDLDPIRIHIPVLVRQLSPKGGPIAAEGILTTDTRTKMCTTQIEVEGHSVTVSGFCKGAGMIEPNMATMLAYICTDAVVEPAALRTCLKEAADASFNTISIDGDTSTNDTVLMFANGRAANTPLTSEHPDWRLFLTAVKGVMFDLAMKIVWDGEGMTKFIELRAEGFASDAEADQALRAIAHSFLVKTGWAGTYPAWSRIADVLGYCGVELDPEGISIHYNDLPLLSHGVPAQPDADLLNMIVAGNQYTITVNPGLQGPGKAVLYTCDCTEEYVRINMF